MAYKYNIFFFEFPKNIFKVYKLQKASLNLSKYIFKVFNYNSQISMAKKPIFARHLFIEFPCL